MRYFLSSIVLGLLLSFSGCGYKEGVVTGEKKSYLYFTGNTKDITVTIDQNPSFTVEAGRDNQYSVKSGKHIVKVFRENQLIIEREIFISDGVAKEIGVQ